MSKKVDQRRRDESPLDGLVRLLDTPHLARVVPHLPSEALHQLVRYRGVEDSAELLAAATPAQLASVVDLDLWQSREPGGDDQFDTARFGEWIEGLVESGPSFAAAIVARLDRQAVTAGIAARVRVFDAAAFHSWSGDDEAPDEQEGPDRGLICEVGGYVVRSRTEECWDAIVAVLAALEADHAKYFQAVMRGCRRLSNSRPEADGLDALPRGRQRLLHDLGVDREERRAKQGYLTAADARAFLEMARRRAGPASGAPGQNPIAAAHLSDAAGDRPPSADAHASPVVDPGATETDPGPEVRKTVDEVAVLLADLSLAAERPRALLAGPERADSRPVVHLLMERLREIDEPTFLARTRELAFLANALVAGCSIHARVFSAQEASEAALATCSLGIASWPGRVPDTFLADHDLVTAFEVGWAALHEASLSVARDLIDVLRGVHGIDSATQQGLVVLRRELIRQCRAGAPWRARDALDVLAVLDTPTWSALLGALDECPVVAEILSAILEGRRGRVSATAFEFVSTTEQLSAMRAFGRKLAALLR